MTSGITLSLRFYRLLLLAYPAPFRHEFAGEMLSAFRSRCVEEASAGGWLNLVPLWFSAFFDTAITAPQEHYFMLKDDLRFAGRTLLKSRGFTAAAVTCLALGIGASTAIFSIVNAVVLKPLPYRDSGRYARLYTEFPNFPNGGLPKFWVSPPEFRQLQAQNRAWDQLEAWVVGGASLSGASQPVRVNICGLSGGMMPMLGVAPALGRWITPANDNPGVETSLVLSDGLWKRAFGGDPKIVGQETWLRFRVSSRCGRARRSLGAAATHRPADGAIRRSLSFARCPPAARRESHEGADRSPAGRGCSRRRSGQQGSPHQSQEPPARFARFPR